MKNYFTLFALNLKYAFKRGDRKQSKWLWLAYTIVAISFLVIIVSLCYGVKFLGELFAEDLLSEFLTVLFGIGSMMVVLLGIAPMLSYLYFSKDTEFMLSLPVKSSTVFFAKLSVVYFFEAVGGAVFLLPALFTLGVTLRLSALFYIGSIFAVMLLPVLPMLIISLVSVPLMWLVGFFRNKSAVAMIVNAVLVVGFMSLYLGVMYSFDFTIPDGEVDGALLYGKLSGIIEKAANVLVPLLAVSRILVLSTDTLFGDFSTPAANFINLAVFLAISVALLLLATVISALAYRRGTRRLVEGDKRRKTGKVEFVRSNGVLKALIAKEWKELIRTPAFAMQCLMGVLMCPLVVGFMCYFDTSDLAGEATTYTAKFMLKIVAFGLILMLGVGTNVGAATSISREGQKFYYMKLMPVPYETQIKAKLILYLTISSITVILSQVVMAIISFDLIFLTAGTAFLLLFNYGFNCYCIYMDLNNPKLNWVTENEACKQNKTAMLAMLTNLVVYVLVTLVGTLCAIFIRNVIVSQFVIWTIFMLIALAVTVVFRTLLFVNVKRLMEKINV